ncbi:MAG TPA: acetolactate synthase small subunit, partial [Clostridia bacterium]|nr:acetolactate synthase small subunit [Clostridia bacterium]
RGSVLDVSSSSLTILLTGDEKKLDGFVEMMKSYEILEIAKTGILAMSRGEKM